MSPGEESVLLLTPRLGQNGADLVAHRLHRGEGVGVGGLYDCVLFTSCNVSHPAICGVDTLDRNQVK